MLEATACKGCGEAQDYPWGYCVACSAVLLDMSREPQCRLNPPEVLEAQLEKIREYADA